MRQLLIPLLLTSTVCFGYRSSFDTVPSSGVPRASVSQIEAMIVEHDNGPDELDSRRGMPHCPKAQRRSHKVRNSRRQSALSNVSKRIWVETKSTPDGGKICGHYVTLPTLGAPDG